MTDGPNAGQPRPYAFIFTNEYKPGYTNVLDDSDSSVPVYEDSRGYGFVEHTSAQPPREVHVREIIAAPRGVEIQEPEFAAEPGAEPEHMNRYGMAFRVKLEPGAYTVQVTLTSAPEDTAVSVSGMNTAAVSQTDYWDAARLVPNRTRPHVEGRVWTCDYVSGRGYLDIEIEPKRTNRPAGIAEVVLTPIPPKSRPEQEKPTIYTLGDSTVKSYIFEEAPMSGWGQVFDNLFDLSRVNVVNYAMGGRSFKNAYTEGRFNDLLMTGCEGDYLLIQFGHNDESKDETRRFGRGATEEMYRTYIEEVYLPAIRARGMIPVLVTPMSRVNGLAKPGHVYEDSFAERKFPGIMREIAGRYGVTLVDLNADSLRYYNEIGAEATTAIFMAIEAGETPGKTLDGSYANGHPSFKNDGTHYKESLSKQFARLVVTRIAELGAKGDPVAAGIASFVREDVAEAIRRNDWSGIYPEIADDIVTGPGAYYRNQIEKLLQLGVLAVDDRGYYCPEAWIRTGEFAEALAAVMDVKSTWFDSGGGKNSDDILTREQMGVMLYDTYRAKFTAKPRYMTDYNSEAVPPDHPDYNPYLAPQQRGIMYYPLVSYEQLTDTDQIDPELAEKVKQAYRLGLFRAEKGIRRGELSFAAELEPKLQVTRAKAAKALYYMWVLIHPAGIENDTLSR